MPHRSRWETSRPQHLWNETDPTNGQTHEQQQEIGCGLGEKIKNKILFVEINKKFISDLFLVQIFLKNTKIQHLAFKEKGIIPSRFSNHI